MREQLRYLEQLQQVDSRIHGLQRQRDAIPARIQELRESLDAIRGILEKERGELEEAERFRREQDLEMRRTLDLINAAKGKLNAVKNPREYHAINRELEAQKRINAEKEEEILRLMTVIEETTKSITAHEAEFRTLLDQVRSEETAGNEQLAGFDSQLGELRQGREAILAHVDGSILAKYDKIFKQRDGLAVVRVVSGCCQGCNMNVPPQLYNALMRQDALRYCPNCHRIIFFKSPKDEAESAKVG